jgi:hypothetical protein
MVRMNRKVLNFSDDWVTCTVFFFCDCSNTIPIFTSVIMILGLKIVYVKGIAQN